MVELSKADIRDLDGFDWLKIEQWDIDKTFNTHVVAGKQLCKICDVWVVVANTEDHLERHIQARKDLTQQRREAALEAARTARDLQREEREATKPPAPPKRPRGRPRKVRTVEELQAEAEKELRKANRLLAQLEKSKA